MNPQFPGSDPTRSEPHQPIYVDPVTGQQLFVDQVTGQLRYGADTRPLPVAPPPPPPPAYWPVPDPHGMSGWRRADQLGSWGPGFYAPNPTDGRATASLVLGIFGLVTFACWGVGAIVGMIGAILGHVAHRHIKETGAEGRGLATAGIVCGWVALGLGVATIAFTVWVESVLRGY
jgi:hypothetical protein